MEYADGELKSVWPELELIALPARERKRLDPALFASLIITLCSRAPLSVRELSVLLSRSEPYIGDAIRPLVTSGQIQFLYPDQPKHPRQKYIEASQAIIEPTPRATVTPQQPPEHVPVRPPEPVRQPQPVPARPTEAVPPPPSVRPPPLRPVQAPVPTPAPAHVHGHTAGPAGPSAPPHRVREPVPSRIAVAGLQAATERATVEPIGGWGGPLVSVAAALTIGIAFALTGVEQWVLYAAALALVFAIAQVFTRSRQYALYLERVHARGAPARTHEMVLFVLIKAAFSFAEIAVAVLGMSLLR